MARVEIKLNHQGIAALLKSEEVLNDLTDRAKRIAEAAGDGMAYSSEIGTKRALAMVWTDSTEARHAEAESRALTSALDAGR